MRKKALGRMTIFAAVAGTPGHPDIKPPQIGFTGLGHLFLRMFGRPARRMNRGCRGFSRGGWPGFLGRNQPVRTRIGFLIIRVNQSVQLRSVQCREGSGTVFGEQSLDAVITLPIVRCRLIGQHDEFGNESQERFDAQIPLSRPASQLVKQLIGQSQIPTHGWHLLTSGSGRIGEMIPFANLPCLDNLIKKVAHADEE
jgi:hypothetical protein